MRQVERIVELPSGVRLCVEEVGRDSDPLIVLVMGLGLDLVWWRDDFCADLISRGFRVARFDNRDVGRSTQFEGPTPGPFGFLTRRANTTYEIEDMADDTAALIADLDPGGGAHVVGVSLGSFIAQSAAIRHPDRVRSLVSIMGRPGDRRTGKVAWSARAGFLRPAPADPDKAVEHMVSTFRRIGSIDRSEVDDDDVRLAMRRQFKREEGTGTGPGRQLAAILGERDRTDGLRGLKMPALVVHGTRDRIVGISGGRATADAIPGAELVEIVGMGHDLARWAWPRVLDGIERTARRAGVEAKPAAVEAAAD